ncbi:MAG: pentapeptide repeat-containing protein [Tannerellaceae bacterium]|nr:pentapeptide repeat-containing protein [Tannerellaceae bacterium]
MIDECKCERTIFEESNLRETELYNTYLKNIDLTSCTIEGVKINIPELKGAIVTSSQAIALTHLLGLTIKY